MAILVATGFAEHDREACEVAKALAKRMRQDLVLLHLADDSTPPTPAVTATLGELAQQLSDGDVKVDVVVLGGDPESALIDYAKRTSPRLVVVGALGSDDAPSGSGQWSKSRMLGATRATPVLHVPPGARLGEVLASGRPPKVFLALDQTAKADAAVIREARAFRTAIPCVFTLLCASAGIHSVVELLHDIHPKDTPDLIVLNANFLDGLLSSPDGVSTPVLIARATRGQTGRRVDGDHAAREDI